MPLLSLEDPAYLTKVFFKAPLACLGLARWLPFNVGAVARQHIKDEKLLKFIDIECFCWSVMPADRTPMINAGMVFSDRHAGGINYPKGGVGVIAEKLVKGLERHGGEIRYKARVTEVLIEHGQAVGVKLADGQTIRAKRVISNATRWDTFSDADPDARAASQQLVDVSHTPSKEQVWRRRYVPSPSFLSLHLGVRADLIPEGTHCHHLLLEDWEQMEDEQGVIFVSMPSLLDADLAPEGHHIVHAFTPSSMQAWHGLSPKQYREKKDADAARLTQRLEAILPGLSEAIAHQEIGTPRSHRRFLGRFQGSYGRFRHAIARSPADALQPHWGGQSLPSVVRVFPARVLTLWHSVGLPVPTASGLTWV